MATQIQIKRGSTTPAGLTVGESAMNTSTNQIYLGGTGGTVLVGGEVTGGVDMGAGSAGSANRIPTQSAVYNYVRNSTVTSFNGATGAVQGVSAAIGSTYLTVSGSTGSVTFTNTGVQTFNGLTGAVTGVTVGGTNVFTALNTFNAGISASALTVSGGVTFTENFSGATGSFSRLLTASAGISAAGGVTFAGTLQGTTSSFTGLVSSTTGFSGSGTNLTGNASGLTAGTATAVNISASNTATTQYLVFASGVGGKTLGIDSTTSPLTYVPSTGSLSVGSSTSSSLSATSVNTTTIYGPNTDALTLTNNGSGVAIEDSGGGVISITNSLANINLDSPNSIVIGDISGVAGGGIVTISDNAGTCTITALDFYAGYANLTGTLTGVTANFTGLNTFSAGISAAGTTAATFNGTVNCNSSTVYKPTLRYYNEVLASPAITANVLTLDLTTAQMFTVSLNANITTFTITNTPATANRSIGFTLIFTADGTARTVTWGAAVKWANNDPPALTSTNAKKDILSFVSPDGGTTWYGFIGGLNF